MSFWSVFIFEGEFELTLVQALLRQVFADAMGCPNKLTSEVIPAYPEEGEEWPSITRFGADVKAIRFRWDKSYSDKQNWKSLQWIINELRKNGPQYSPAAAGAIADISEDDLQGGVIWKFNELVKMVKNWKKAQAAIVVVVSISPEADGAGAAGDVATKKSGLKEL